MDVNVATPDGVKTVSTDGVTRPAPVVTAAVRRFTTSDIETPLGTFLANRLCDLASDIFNERNWKAKVSYYTTSNECFLVTYKNALALAIREYHPLRSTPLCRAMFLFLPNKKATEDGIVLLNAIRDWAKNMSGEVIFSYEEAFDVSPKKAFPKIETRTEYVISVQDMHNGQ